MQAPAPMMTLKSHMKIKASSKISRIFATIILLLVFVFSFNFDIQPVKAASTGNSVNPPPPLNLNNVAWGDTNVSGWAQTANLSSVSINSSSICFNYDKANSWSVAFPLGGSDPASNGLIGNPWIFVYRSGQWRASTFDWFRLSQTCKNDFGNIAGRSVGGALNGSGVSDFLPVAGETYGFMVSTIARSGAAAFNGQERSNVVMKTWTGPAINPGGGGSSSSSGSFVGYGFPDVWVNIESAGKGSQFLDELKNAGGNFTLVLGLTNQNLSGQMAPWAKSGSRFDLNSPSNSFYSMLSSFMSKASQRNISTFLVQHNVWNHQDPQGWQAFPFNPANNINPETAGLTSGNFIVELSSAVNGDTSTSRKAFLRKVWQDFTQRLSTSSPTGTLFLPISEDFKEVGRFNKSGFYSQVSTWWGKGNIVDNVSNVNSGMVSAATWKDVHDNSQNVSLLKPGVIANTDVQCNPPGFSIMVNMIRQAITVGGNYIVYDCASQGASWSSSVISAIKTATNGIQPMRPTGGSGGTSGGRFISTVTPIVGIPGTVINLFGTNLSTTVQFFDSAGARTSTVGSVDPYNSQVTVAVPQLANGNYTIKVGPNLTDVSNAVAFRVGSGAGTTPTGRTISSVTPNYGLPGTNITIQGINLSTTVQFFDAQNSRTTVVGSIDPSKTTVQVQVPQLNLGLHTLRVGPSLTDASNIIQFNVGTTPPAGAGSGSGGYSWPVGLVCNPLPINDPVALADCNFWLNYLGNSTPAPVPGQNPSTPAQYGLQGSLDVSAVYNSKEDSILLLANQTFSNGFRGVGGEVIDGKTLQSIKPVFRIDNSPTFAGAPRGAYDSDLNQFLVVFEDERNGTNTRSNYGRILEGDGDPLNKDFFINSPNSLITDLDYDQVNKRYFMIREYGSGNSNGCEMVVLDSAGAVTNRINLKNSNVYEGQCKAVYNFRTNQYIYSYVYASGVKPNEDIRIYYHAVDAATLQKVTSAPVQLSVTRVGGGFGASDVAFDHQSGNTVVGWTENRGNNIGVYGRVIYPSGNIGSEFTIIDPVVEPSASGYGFAEGPVMTYSPYSNMIVAAVADSEGGIWAVEIDPATGLVINRNQALTPPNTPPTGAYGNFNHTVVPTKNGVFIPASQNRSKVIGVTYYIPPAVNIISCGNTCPTYTLTPVNTSSVASTISQIYVWALGVAGILALAMMIFGGYIIMTAGGNGSQVSKGKEYITSAIIGLVILLTSFILLNTINPDLTNFTQAGSTIPPASQPIP